MPRKARRRSTWRAAADNWRASGNWMDMISLRLGIAWLLGPKSVLSRFHARVIEPAQAAARLGLDLVVDGVEVGLRLGQLLAEALQGVDEHLHVGLADEPDPGLGVRQRQAAPVVDGPAADRSQLAEGLVAHVQD